MPDLSGFPIIDVVVGLTFVFVLLSTALASINEGIANVLGWRAKTLEDGIRSLLDDRDRKDGEDLTSAVFRHWRIRTLVRDPESRWRRRRQPSYLPPSAASLAVAETLAEREPDRVKGSLEEFREQFEGLFDETMERASGWYKRKVQAVLLVLAAATAIGLNIDTVHMASRLWNDDSVRQAVVAKAAEAERPPQEAADIVDDVRQLQLPIGWGGDNAPDDVGDVLLRFPGWLMTVAALTLGAPFWFDVLSRFARLRGTGVPERPRALSDTVGTQAADAQVEKSLGGPGG